MSGASTARVRVLAIEKKNVLLQGIRNESLDLYFDVACCFSQWWEFQCTNGKAYYPESDYDKSNDTIPYHWESDYEANSKPDVKSHAVSNSCTAELHGDSDSSQSKCGDAHNVVQAERLGLHPREQFVWPLLPAVVQKLNNIHLRSVTVKRNKSA